MEKFNLIPQLRKTLQYTTIPWNRWLPNYQESGPLFFDDFNSVSSVLLENHTPDVNKLGGNWIVPDVPITVFNGEVTAASYAKGVLDSSIVHPNKWSRVQFNGVFNSYYGYIGIMIYAAYSPSLDAITDNWRIEWKTTTLGFRFIENGTTHFQKIIPYSYGVEYTLSFERIQDQLFSIKVDGVEQLQWNITPVLTPIEGKHIGMIFESRSKGTSFLIE